MYNLLKSLSNLKLMNRTIFALALSFSPVYIALPSQAQQAESNLFSPLPSQIEQLAEPSQVEQIQQQFQEQFPLFYLFLQLDKPQNLNLQQQAEAEIRAILEEPPSLQQQILQQQIEQIENQRR